MGIWEIDMKLFQVSLPRTRSTLLYESTRDWQRETQGLINVDGHSELFLEWGRNMELVDRKTEESHTTELYPMIHEDGIEMHFVYPHILKTTSARNKYKINLLRKERDSGREYLIKGTLNMAESCEEVFDFFSDRKIILTTREDREAMMMSFFFSWEIKMFHARKNNLEIYKDRMNKGVVVPNQIIYDYIPFVRQYDKIEAHLKTSNIQYTVLTYEQLEDSNVISETLGTDEWKRYVSKDTVPIHIEKNYRNLIHNYDEVLEILKKENVL